MEDRIQINGVWYVRENTAHVDDSFRKYMQENVVTYQCITYEDSDWLFQGHSDMIGFSKWLLSVDDMDNQNRYFYIEDKDDFIDDDRNRYTWEDMYRIYQKN